MLPKKFEGFILAGYFGFTEETCLKKAPACPHLESCKLIDGKHIKITNPKFPALYSRLTNFCPIKFATWVFVGKEEIHPPEEDFPEIIFYKKGNLITYKL